MIGLQALFELAAVLGAGHHGRQVERARCACPCRISGTLFSTMRCARPSAMAVLPTPGSPISTGLFFLRRREHLDHALDLRSRGR